MSYAHCFSDVLPRLVFLTSYDDSYMFHFDRGLKLTEIDLGLDCDRRLPRGFISHAHADHLAPHELAFGTPATLRFYRHRLGARRRVSPIQFGEPKLWGNLELTVWPAGHMLGSSMLRADDGSSSMLYTGDFKLKESLTAEPAELPQTDTLIMECTFGRPEYRWTSREAVIDQLVNRLERLHKERFQPVIHAYVLGKAQEVSAILSQRGLRVIHHPLVHEYSQLYEELGCSLGDYQLFNNAADCDGGVLIAPPQDQKCQAIHLPRPKRIAVTGWSNDVHARRRYRVDYSFPLSDHADFDELLECVDRVAPKRVLCTHGPKSFVYELRDRGVEASWLE